MITFIIPTINRPTLDRAIDSLLKQKNTKWKCIALFDGITKKEFSDERIKSFEVKKMGNFGQNHGNAGLVRNQGIELCETEWIAFLDDDDTLNENYVDWLYNYIEKGYEMVLFRMITHDGKIIPSMTNNNIIMNNAGISFAYKKSLNCKFINSDVEDFIFLEQIKKKTNKYIIAKEIAYYVKGKLENKKK